MQRILIIGASGYIGSHIIPDLVQKGYQVTATARNIKLLQNRGWHKYNNLTLHPLDLKSPCSLPQLLQEHDVVLFLVHGMAHGHDFIDYELDLAHNFRDALKKKQNQTCHLLKCTTTKKRIISTFSHKESNRRHFT